MNNYNYDDLVFKQTSIYKNFSEKYPVSGNLRIRAYTAGGAVPVSGLNVIIFNEFNNSKIIFYQGKTDESGLIENITLPAPKLNIDDTTVPNSITYSIEVYDDNKNLSRIYKANVYENVYVVQNINIVPNMAYMMGGYNGN